MGILLAAGLVFLGCQGTRKTTSLGEEYYRLGTLYLDLKRYDDAARTFLEAVEWDRKLVRKGNYNLAWAYTYLKRYDEARRLVESLLEQDPENLLLLELSAFIASSEGQWEEARSIYDRILLRSPTNRKALFNRGIVEKEIGDPAEAVLFFEEAYQLQRSAEGARQLALAYQELKDTDKAVLFFERSLDHDDQQKEVLSELLALYKELENYEKALERIDRFLVNRARGEQLDILFEKARLHFLYTQDFREGFALLRQLFREGFEDVAALKKLQSEVPASVKQQLEALVIAQKLPAISEVSPKEPKRPKESKEEQEPPLQEES